MAAIRSIGKTGDRKVASFFVSRIDAQVAGFGPSGGSVDRKGAGWITATADIDSRPAELDFGIAAVIGPGQASSEKN